MKQKLEIVFINVLAIALFFAAALAPNVQARESEKSLSAATSHYAVLDGSRIHYKSLGKGDRALIFVHGWMCSMDFWRLQAPAFADKTRVIVIDLPAFQHSGIRSLEFT